MTDERGLDLEPSDLEAFGRHVVQGQPAWQIPQPNRKERGGQVPGQPACASRAWRRGTPDMNLAAPLVEGFEEAEPLDVVHVEMGQQQVDAPPPAAPPWPPAAGSPSGVQDQERVPLASHLDARRVAAVADCLRPCGRQATASPPERDPSRQGCSQKIPTAPSWPGRPAPRAEMRSPRSCATRHRALGSECQMGGAMACAARC